MKVKDNMKGNGKFFFSNNQVYEGQFKNNEFNGVGKIMKNNGTLIYEGEFKNYDILILMKVNLKMVNLMEKEN